MNKCCKCKKCMDCCWHNPGWFGSKEEIIGAAKLMNCSLKEFADKYLVQEWWSGEDETCIPAPIRNINKIDNETKEHIKEMEENNMPCSYFDTIKKSSGGFKRATWGHNLVNGFACIFLDENNLCKIHESKPYECKETFGCKKPTGRKRPKIVKYWKKHQNWIEKNLKN